MKLLQYRQLCKRNDMFVFVFYNLVDVFWNLFVPGCFSLCVHPASFASFSGIVPVHHSALLWLTVSFCFV